MQVDFYHLTATPLARALPSVAGRIVSEGGRLLIVSASDEQRVDLDRMLWTYTADSFLPHALAGGGSDSEQPVLISADATPVNGARFVALVDGEWRQEALEFDRAFHFFDDGRIGEARLAWKALAERDGVERRYWKQNDAGRWEQAV